MKLNIQSALAVCVFLAGCGWFSQAGAAETCVPPPAGLVSWWRAESDARDALGANHAANLGGVTFTAGKVGQAFSFNSTANSSLTIPNSPRLLPASGQFTIEAWIKPDFTAANVLDTIFGKRDGCNSANISYLLVIAKAGLGGFSVGEVILVMTTTGSGTVQLSSGSAHVVPADNQFHHVAATYEGALVKIYLDGQLVGQAERTGPIAPSISPVEIGGHGGTCADRSVAAMDEVAFFDWALAASEIQAIFNAGSTGKCADKPVFLTGSLVDGAVNQPYSQTIQAGLTPGPYTFQLVSGTLPSGLTLASNGVLSGTPLVGGTNSLTIRVTDSLGASAQSSYLLRIAECAQIPAGLVSWWRAESDAMDTLGFNHGALHNGASFATGKLGRAFSFDGIDDRVEAANAANLNPTTAVTLDAWVNPQAWRLAYGAVVAKSLESMGQRSYGMWITADGRVHVEPSSLGTSSAYTEQSVVPLNTWTHVTAVITAGVGFKIYVNGVERTLTGLGPPPTLSATTVPVTIGNSDMGTHDWLFSGLIDEVEIFDRALAAPEILAIYVAGSAGKCSDAPYFITSVLPDGRAGSPYSKAIQAALGTPPYAFTLTSGALAAGLNLGADGVLQGNPLVAGTNTLTIRVTDSLGRSADRDFMLNITPCLEIPSGLVAYWPFNGDTMDLVGTNHGTIEGSPYFTNGISGMGLFFSGADQVRVKHSPDLSFEAHDPMSVSIWVHPMDQNVGHMFGKRLPQCTGGNEMNYQMVFDGRPSVGFGPLGSTAATDRELPLGAWTHLAATFDGTTMRFYFNGIEAGIDTTHFLGPTNQYDLLIGGSGLCEHFRGIIDEFAIYRRALSADEITALFTNQGRPPLADTTPPVITCPSNIVSNTDPGQCSRSNVTYIVTATDNCPGVTIMCSPPSGSTLAKGVTTVTCTATDASGNTNTCSFTVTVRDMEPPQFTGATVYNLSADWSDVTNPFGPWKLWKSRTEIFTINQPDYDGSGENVWADAPFPQLRHAPAWWRYTLPGIPGSYGPGDIFVHGAELDHTGSDFTSVRWTAPAAGTAEFVGKVWTIDTLGRSQRFVLRKNGIDLTDTVLTGDGTHSGQNPVRFDQFSAGPAATRQPVVAGDELELAVITLSENGNLGNFMALGLEIRLGPLSTDLVVTTDPGQCSKSNVFYPIMAVDNCPGVTMSCNPPSGSTFPKGVTLVTCTATDASGNTNSYSFTVTVRDVEPPAIICPINIVVNTDPGQCSRSNVTYAATATDNCPGVTVTCSPPSGSTFAKGVTSVTCVATDASGNTNTCSFTVTVRDLEPPQFNCPSNIVVNGSFENGSFSPDGNGFMSLASGSTAMIGWTTFSGELVWATFPNVAAWPASDGNYFLDLSGYHDSPPYGGIQKTLTTANGTAYRVTFDLGVNQSAPEARGPIVVRVAATGTASQEFTYDPPGSGIQWGGFAYDFVANGPSVDLSLLGISSAGGKAIALDNVSVEPRQSACPSNIVVNTDPGQCSKSNVTYTATATDNCPGVTVSCSPPSGSTFAKGVTTVTCAATDASGNTNTYSFTVTVRDLEPPQLNCPSNIVVNTDAGQCAKSNVTYTATATDNCPGVTVLCSPPSGSTFAKGVTTVTCAATDATGNTNSCSFTVTVADATPPVITCPSNLATICNLRTGAMVNFTVSAADECDPNVSVVCTPPSGSVFPFGTTTVNCTATDTSGHMASCSFTITVLEPFLRIALVGDDIVVTWDGNGTLQYADELLGDGPPTVWIDVPENPASPYTVAPSAAKRFYRVSGCHD